MTIPESGEDRFLMFKRNAEDLLARRARAKQIDVERRESARRDAERRRVVQLGGDTGR